ncbi:hypothetical protein [uncultured Tateyamaria sp.]|uniref:hypothetical protein n=1 Tax=uncultured Tateyamaria sp. TaxID=455651 RepID=UPI00263650EA|nr:hypothetical protein [uncultured Tateyamaria sp.]
MTEHHVDPLTLDRVATHLGSLSDDALYIEHIVAQLIAHQRDSVTSTFVQDLQRLDHLSQSLRDLSRLVQALTADGQDRVHHLNSLKLSATRDLLNDAPKQATQASGVVDLF